MITDPIYGQPRYGVWCEVSGGVTGDRESWLKRDGVLELFATREEAADRADAIRAKISGRGPATFRYTARRYD